MARVVVVVGHVFSVRASAVELARRLAADGHDLLVVVPTGSPAFDGVRVVEHDLPTVGEALGAGGTEASLVAAVRTWRARRRHAVLERVDDRLVALLEGHDPDLVVVDAELVTTVANVLAAGHRTALLTPFPGILRDLARPPAHVGIVPGRGPRGSRAGIAASWLRHHLETEARWVVRWLRGRGDSDRARSERLVRHLGLPRGTTSRLQWLQPLTFPGLPVLETNLAELDLPSTPDPRRHVVGPMVVAPERVEDLDAEVAQRVRRVEAAREAGERVVYCSFGSFASSYDLRLLQRVVDAVERVEGARLVLGLGGAAEADDGPAASLRTGPDTIVFGWAPQRLLLRHADAAVVHGGQSVHECVEAAVPMVVLPMVFDQPGYAARVAFHGVGEVGPADPASEPLDAMVARVRRVLHDEGVRARVRAAARAQHAAREDGLLEQAVRSVLADG